MKALDEDIGLKVGVRGDRQVMTEAARGTEAAKRPAPCSALQAQKGVVRGRLRIPRDGSPSPNDSISWSRPS